MDREHCSASLRRHEDLPAQDPPTVSIPFSLLLRALACNRLGFKPTSCCLVTLGKLLNHFKPQFLYLKMEITIVLFIVRRIKQDKPSHIKSWTCLAHEKN